MAPEHPQGFDDALGASYRLISKLGEGASGEVWRTEHRRTGDIVATKLLRPEHLADKMLVRRFFEERDVLTGLRHPGVVAVRDLVAEGDRLAIVMEYVDGGSLGEVLRSRGPLPPTLAVDVTAAVLDGLAAAHQQGVVHRDIKPDNVLLRREWWSLRPGDVKLVDFGIAQILTESSSGMTGGLTGTPEFMAPELVARGVAERPADLYGVGVLLYQLLAGRTPFAGPGNAYTIAHRHIGSEPPPLDVPEGLAGVLGSLLSKNPDARPDAVSAAAALRRVRGELSGLPALPRQDAPAEFSEARGAATLLRGPDDAAVGPATVFPDSSTPEGAARIGTDFDLGVPSQATTLRPFMAAPPVISAADVAPVPIAHRPGWKDPRLIVLVAACVVLISGAVLFVTLRPGGGSSPAGAAAGTSSTADDGPVTSRSATPTALVSGLTIDQVATYDPEQGTVDLAVTYSASPAAPLTGPFLQVVPGAAADQEACPVEVTWEGATGTPNQATATGISTKCAYAVDVGTVEAGNPVTATASFSLDLGGDDPQTVLDEWLASAEEITGASLDDPTLTGDAYPVQRLVGITVEATPRTPPGRTINLTFLPQWSGGGPVSRDAIYRTPSTGDPSSVLTAIAGPEGVRLSDNCGGNINVVDGVASAGGFSGSSCSVSARVGAFSDLTSNDIAIVPSGS